MINISDELRNILDKLKDDIQIKDNIEKLLNHDGSIVDYINISINDMFKISYVSGDRVLEDKKVNWHKNRNISTLGKIIKKIDNISDAEISLLSAKFKSQVISIHSENIKFDIVDGDDIINYYINPKLSSLGGSLSNSCMRHEYVRELIKFYTINSDKVKLLILTDTNGLLGRALLWNVNDDIFCDRVYTVNDDFYIDIFRDYCKKNGFYYRSRQKPNSSLHFTSPNNDDKIMHLEIEFDINLENELMPYLDTFKFYHNYKLYNYKPNNECKLFNSTIGLAMDSSSIIFDKHLGDYNSINDMVMVNGEYVTISLTRYSRIFNRYILEKESKSINNEIIYKDDNMNLSEDNYPYYIKTLIFEDSQEFIEKCIEFNDKMYDYILFCESIDRYDISEILLKYLNKECFINFIKNNLLFKYKFSLLKEICESHGLKYYDFQEFQSLPCEILVSEQFDLFKFANNHKEFIYWIRSCDIDHILKRLIEVNYRNKEFYEIIKHNINCDNNYDYYIDFCEKEAV